MTTDMNDKRNLVIEAASSQVLREKIGQIPSYSVEALEPELLRSISPRFDQHLFYLRTPSGDRISIMCEDGSAKATTWNVLDQDRSSDPTPLHKDELLLLHEAIRSVDGLTSYVELSKNDTSP